MTSLCSLYNVTVLYYALWQVVLARSCCLERATTNFPNFPTFVSSVDSHPSTTRRGSGVTPRVTRLGLCCAWGQTGKGVDELVHRCSSEKKRCCVCLCCSAGFCCSVCFIMLLLFFFTFVLSLPLVLAGFCLQTREAGRTWVTEWSPRLFWSAWHAPLTMRRRSVATSVAILFAVLVSSFCLENSLANKVHKQNRAVSVHLRCRAATGWWCVLAAWSAINFCGCFCRWQMTSSFEKHTAPRTTASIWTSTRTRTVSIAACRKIASSQCTPQNRSVCLSWCNSNFNLRCDRWCLKEPQLIEYCGVVGPTLELKLEDGEIDSKREREFSACLRKEVKQLLIAEKLKSWKGVRGRLLFLMLFLCREPKKTGLSTWGSPWYFFSRSDLN